MGSIFLTARINPWDDPRECVQPFEKVEARAREILQSFDVREETIVIAGYTVDTWMAFAVKRDGKHITLASRHGHITQE